MKYGTSLKYHNKLELFLKKVQLEEAYEDNQVQLPSSTSGLTKN